MKLKSIIYNIFDEIIIENKQLADKIYFKTGKLSEQDKQLILNITNGDHYTKLISDFYYQINDNEFYYKDYSIKEYIEILYNELKNYNKNVFPIEGFDIYNLKNPHEYIKAFLNRRDIIIKLNSLPSIAKRNLKSDMRKERSPREIQQYQASLTYVMNYLNLLNNRDESTKNKIYNKMFKSNTTIDHLINFVQDKGKLIGGYELNKEQISKLSEDSDFDIVYDKNNIMVVEVYSFKGIRDIGCNSLWCFTYFSKNDYEWFTYSHENMVYVIIDFKVKSDNKDFMNVLIKPLLDEDYEFIDYEEDEYPMYDMTNDPVNPYDVLSYHFGENYKNIVKKYLNWNN